MWSVFILFLTLILSYLSTWYYTGTGTFVVGAPCVKKKKKSGYDMEHLNALNNFIIFLLPLLLLPLLLSYLVGKLLLIQQKVSS